MSLDEFYLRPNTVVEPLIMRWYAWTHLVFPPTAARNVVGRHLKIMNSYIQSAQIHAAAVMNPKMKGGPFMDYDRPRVEEIKQLKAATIEKQEMLVLMSKALSDLDKVLKEHSKGFSLEGLYEKVPELLRGYVELVYDLNNNPAFRFFEALLYKSEFYDKSTQSIALWLTENDERPFCLSTPKLNDPGVLHLDIPFDHPGIDALSKMKRTPGARDEIAALLGVGEDQRELFDSFFTLDKHPTYRRYTGQNIRMRYFGHACILIETKDVNILVDPLISYYGYESSVEHFSDVDLPDTIDYILITHNHQDHILFETLLPLRHKTRNIIVPRTGGGALQDPNVRLIFNHAGFENVIEIDEMQSLSFGDCTITGLPFTGEHSDLDVRAKICYHVAVGNNTFLFMADSRIVEPAVYRNICRQVKSVDVLFLGMECEGAPLSWLYGPLLNEELPREKDQSRRLSGSDFIKGMSLVDIFDPREVYVYAMGQEPWLEFISSIKYTPESHPIVQSDMLVRECHARGIIAERLFGEKELLYDRKRRMEVGEKTITDTGEFQMS